MDEIMQLGTYLNEPIKQQIVQYVQKHPIQHNNFKYDFHKYNFLMKNNIIFKNINTSAYTSCVFIKYVIKCI